LKDCGACTDSKLQYLKSIILTLHSIFFIKTLISIQGDGATSTILLNSHFNSFVELLKARGMLGLHVETQVILQ